MSLASSSSPPNSSPSASNRRGAREVECAPARRRPEELVLGGEAPRVAAAAERICDTTVSRTYSSAVTNDASDVRTAAAVATRLRSYGGRTAASRSMAFDGRGSPSTAATELAEASDCGDAEAGARAAPREMASSGSSSAPSGRTRGGRARRADSARRPPHAASPRRTGAGQGIARRRRDAPPRARPFRIGPRRRSPTARRARRGAARDDVVSSRRESSKVFYAEEAEEAVVEAAEGRKRTPAARRRARGAARPSGARLLRGGLGALNRRSSARGLEPRDRLGQRGGARVRHRRARVPLTADRPAEEHRANRSSAARGSRGPPLAAASEAASRSVDSGVVICRRAAAATVARDRRRRVRGNARRRCAAGRARRRSRIGSLARRGHQRRESTASRWRMAVTGARALSSSSGSDLRNAPPLAARPPPGQDPDAIGGRTTRCG